jgi:hypothetical protein
MDMIFNEKMEIKQNMDEKTKKSLANLMGEMDRILSLVRDNYCDIKNFCRKSKFDFQISVGEENEVILTGEQTYIKIKIDNLENMTLEQLYDQLFEKKEFITSSLYDIRSRLNYLVGLIEQFCKEYEKLL